MLCVARFPDLYTSGAGVTGPAAQRTRGCRAGRSMVGGCLDRVARPGRGRGRPDGTAGHPPAREYVAPAGHGVAAFGVGTFAAEVDAAGPGMRRYSLA